MNSPLQVKLQGNRNELLVMRSGPETGKQGIGNTKSYKNIKHLPDPWETKLRWKRVERSGRGWGVAQVMRKVTTLTFITHFFFLIFIYLATWHLSFSMQDLSRSQLTQA